MKIRIDTGAVRQGAQNIQRMNNEMRNRSAIMENAIARMDGTCDSAGVDRAVGALREMRATMMPQRHRAIERFVTFLNSQIASGYEAAETKNISLAAEFE
ncbi:MAG: hypothetical protein K5705_01350 [Oscillospiraceae bacterium]|nr:hypothetical protein [Oscillospiraceae bacterium]MCR4758913.1 hypothetical protein [Oscillospiraceae bacterium]